MNEIFGINSVGIVTARDEFTIKWTKEQVLQTVKIFMELDTEIAREAYKLGKDVRDWKVNFAQKDLKETGLDENRVVSILYRPFDVRYTYYTGKSRGFHCMPRPEVMSHMLAGENLGLITTRQVSEGVFKHVLVANSIVESCYVSNRTREIGYLFPLYLYPSQGNPSKNEMFATGEAPTVPRIPNIKKEILEMLTNYYLQTPTPEEIFYYIYAVLYSNIYRTKYAEFLKIDFPRIPFTVDYETFAKLSTLGEELVNLHLLKSQKLSTPIAKYSGTGEDAVEKVKYVEQEHRVYINPNKYFENITPDVFTYQIGGYQVLNKWLKDRTGRVLTLSEIEQYCKIVTALSETIELQKQIDEVYKSVEKTLIKIAEE